MSNIIEKYFTKSNRITSPVIITPEYLVIHSTGCGYTSKDSLYNAHNKAGANSEHGIVDDTGSYHTLPFNYRGGHIGAKGNPISLGVEICEPKWIAYADKSHSKIDTTKYDPKDPKNIEDFEKRWNNAVDFACCVIENTNIKIENIVSHAEAYQIGFGTNHSDTGHWFPLFGKSMNDFREEVQRRLSCKEKEIYYCVQIGAFHNRNYAVQLLEQLKKDGYDGYIVKKEIEK